MELHFEWDIFKAQSNLRKHGVSFVEACDVFLDPLAIWLHDDEHSQLEDRWVAIGQVHSKKLVVVVHTWREDGDQIHVRIISARSATAHEAKTYEG